MREGKALVGTIISADIPQLAGLLPALGFDFIFIDLEHGTVSEETITALVLSKKESCKIFIRINEISEAGIKHALDLGCDGIIAPRVESMDEVQMMADYAYYPPVGKRSLGFSLANKFGHDPGYVQNFKPILLPQVESIKGVEIAGEIAAHAKVDGIFVGPYDLSMSLGVQGGFDTPVFKTAYGSVINACKANNKTFATFTVNTETAIKEIQDGADMVVVGVDMNLFLNMYKEMINQVKNA